MTEVPPQDGSIDEPVSKRTRRSGIVASIGDPNLTDRSKVAPLFLSKKEKQEKQYKKEQEKLAQSTKTRLNDWKSVIGVEKDATKVCPVFQRASLASSFASNKPEATDDRANIPELAPIAPLTASSIVPDILSLPRPSQSETEICFKLRESCTPSFAEEVKSVEFHRVLELDSGSTVNLVTPCKQAPEVANPPKQEYEDIDKPLQTSCIAAIRAMAECKPKSSQIPDWLPMSSRDWCAARVEPRKQHALSKWLSKWKDEDTAVKRNKIAPILLVSGPSGCGKTSLVYSAATELNIQVLEVSPADFSWQANGKRTMTEAVREALQSRQVKNEGALSQIVLIDDVDILAKEDRSVLSAIMSMTDDSKRPLVLTCTDELCITDSNVDVTQIFQIAPIDYLAASYLIHAYSVVIGEDSKAPLRRSQADLIARYTGGNLRKIATAMELARYTEAPEAPDVLPSCVFSGDWTMDLFTKKEELLRTLSCDNDLPISLRNQTTDSNLIDLPEIVFSMLDSEKDLISVEQWERIVSDISIGAMTGVPERLTGRLSMHSACARLNRKEWVKESELRTSLDNGRLKIIDNIKGLVEPFFYMKSGVYVSGNPMRVASVISCLGSLAQLSSSSEFSSRRVRCFLDKFPGAVAEVATLRRLFHPN
jgi:DNA polymerase III delta prime subunit